MLFFHELIVPRPLIAIKKYNILNFAELLTTFHLIGHGHGHLATLMLGQQVAVGLLKGSVSRKLRPMLLYIIRKLFIKPLSAYHFHKVLLKGYAAIYVKKAQRLANILL